MMRTVFYAWQSDLPGNTNRNFVEKCLERAINELTKTLAPNAGLQLDKDTQGVPGMVPISDVILQKIDASAIFVADLSIVTVAGSGRQMPNGNVLFELGYAMKSISDRRIVCVFNEAFGSREDLPFDIRHRRWPIGYTLKPDASESERRTVQHQLVKDLTAAIGGVIGADQPTSTNAESTSNDRPTRSLAMSAVAAAREAARVAKFAEETKLFFRSPEGIQAADDAVVRIYEELCGHVSGIATENRWDVAFGRNNSVYCVVRLQGSTVLMNWQRYVNSVEGCELHVRVLGIPIETPDETRAGKSFLSFGKQEPTYDRAFQIQRTLDLGVCWQSGQTVLTAEQVAADVLNSLIRQVTQQR